MKEKGWKYIAVFFVYLKSSEKNNHACYSGSERRNQLVLFIIII